LRRGLVSAKLDLEVVKKAVPSRRLCGDPDVPATTAFEFYSSEQYMRAVPLTDPQSLWENPQSICSPHSNSRDSKN
jgi:hypothetical protein